MAKQQLTIDHEARLSKAHPMGLSDYLRQQAELCIAISRGTFDLTMAGRLRALASEFQDKAQELDDEMAPILPHMIAQNGART